MVAIRWESRCDTESFQTAPSPVKYATLSVGAHSGGTESPPLRTLNSELAIRSPFAADMTAATRVAGFSNVIHPASIFPSFDQLISPGATPARSRRLVPLFKLTTNS